MSVEEFNRLPLLLSTSHMEKCGIRRRAIRLLIRERRLTFITVGSWKRYHKNKVAEVLGLRA